MSEPFIAEIRIFAGNFAPRSWAFCNGQLLPISQNTALFSLIGTTYGGDGRTTTALPNMAGRAPMHPGRGPGLTSRRLGQRGGTEMVTLAESQLPNHNHSMYSEGGTLATEAAPSDTRTFAASPLSPYHAGTPDIDMAYETLPTEGGSQAHNNMQPYLTMNFIIALQGLYPSRG
ncbi:phage tail protein [Stappia stellulata]|uniref:phage tail protein n=1 Tax=Stappia stellulata TaxID=71235 RepID=UPI0004246220|nr:tail fiber protein [Stappia stellulata]